MVIPLNRVYCKHPIYHKTPYNKSGGESKFPKEDEKILPPAELLADYFKKRKALDHEIDKTLAEIQRILGIIINIEE